MISNFKIKITKILKILKNKKMEMNSLQDPVPGNVTTANLDYWTHPFNCDCDLGVDFINFWTSAGYCCDNLRLSIWYVFNILFFFIMLLAGIKIVIERRKRRKELNDFSERTTSLNNAPFSNSFF